MGESAFGEESVWSCVIEHANLHGQDIRLMILVVNGIDLPIKQRTPCRLPNRRLLAMSWLV